MSGDNSSVLGGQVSGGGSNPAWDEILQAVPEEYHEALTPTLQKWDSGVNERFQKIHSEYEDFKPFKEQGLSRSDLEFAMSLSERIENDPLEIYNALETYLRQEGLLSALSQETPADVAQQPGESNVDYAERISQLEAGFNTVAEAYLLQEQMKAEAEEDAALEAEFGALRSQYGDFDEEYVLTKMIGGMDTEDAVRAYFEFVDGLMSNKNRPAPRIINSAGSAYIGQPEVDVRKWNADQREGAVADYIARMLDS